MNALGVVLSLDSWARVALKTWILDGPSSPHKRHPKRNPDCKRCPKRIPDGSQSAQDGPMCPAQPQ
eukprot:2226952-Pyramimonas_sp.AAC.1